MTHDIADIRARFQTIRRDLSAVFRERENAIECITLAALSGSHVLLVGPPGTAKSALFFAFLDSFSDASKFQRVLTKFSTEDDVFGPVMLSALKNDKLCRNLDGRLAAVNCAFMDEVFKGSDSVLNCLLEAMNERRYAGAQIPLRMMVGASNELPEDEILAAMYDRFLLRDVVEYIEAEDAWMDLISAPPTYAASVHISMAEWDAAREDVARVTLPRRVVEEMLRIKKELKKAGLVISDRRWIALTKVLRAAAWLDGCPEVELDHLVVLQYGLWTKPEERAQIAGIFATLDNGIVTEATTVLDRALGEYRSLPTDRTARRGSLGRVADAINKAIEHVSSKMEEGVSRAARARLEPKLVEAQEAHGQLTRELSQRYVPGLAPRRVPA